MHLLFVEYKMLLFTIYIQYLTSTFAYLRKLCIVVKYAVLINKDLLATIGWTFTVGAEWGLRAPFRGGRGSCAMRGQDATLL